MNFQRRLLPAPVNGGFQHEGHWVWCGSVVPGDDGRYHMFASMWSQDYAFAPNWLFNSRIVRAVADRPEGPYTLAEEVFGPRDPSYWDGRMAHNPTIHRWQGRYYLFYIGTTYPFAVPKPGEEHPLEHKLLARRHKRIGVAVADRVEGPWRRPDAPALEPRPGKWDSGLTSNPAPLIHADGRTLLVYKSAPTMTTNQKQALNLGLAEASHPEGPYHRVHDEPLFDFGTSGGRAEDACIWFENGMYHMIYNDLEGTVTGQDHSGAYASSPDGYQWQLHQGRQAYSRHLLWDDGCTILQGSLERPQVLVQQGRATHLFCATADGPGHFTRASKTWNVCIPLRTSDDQNSRS